MQGCCGSNFRCPPLGKLPKRRRAGRRALEKEQGKTKEALALAIKNEYLGARFRTVVIFDRGRVPPWPPWGLRN